VLRSTKKCVICDDDWQESAVTGVREISVKVAEELKKISVVD
jgi:hypothetical protein